MIHLVEVRLVNTAPEIELVLKSLTDLGYKFTKSKLYPRRNEPRFSVYLSNFEFPDFLTLDLDNYPKIES